MSARINTLCKPQKRGEKPSIDG